jgi:hypothetical protein
MAEVLKGWLAEYLPGIMVFLGIVLFVVGLLFMQVSSSPVSVIGFFFGIVLIAFGILARVGFFSTNLRSLNGLGTVLICISVVFFSLSFSVLQFQEVSGYVQIPVMDHGVIIGYMSQPNYYRPYTWLSLTSIGICLSMLFAGLIAKVLSTRR